VARGAAGGDRRAAGLRRFTTRNRRNRHFCFRGGFLLPEKRSLVTIETEVTGHVFEVTAHLGFLLVHFGQIID